MSGHGGGRVSEMPRRQKLQKKKAATPGHHKGKHRPPLVTEDRTVACALKAEKRLAGAILAH